MKHCMNNVEKRKILSEVALGSIPPDTLFLNGTLFNAFTREFISRQAIWIKDGMIAYVGPDPDPLKDDKTVVIDADGMVLLPGLIEGHTHVPNRSGIEEFIRHVIPCGVTTVVTETMEFAMIAGKVGVEHFARGLEGQPIRIYYTMSSMCSVNPSDEVNVPTDEEILLLLKDPRCLGIGEVYWGNIFHKGKQGERLRKLTSIVLNQGKRAEGHTAGAAGRKLQAYTCFGISSCHEPITEEEVLERLRLGYCVMIREGSVRKELDGVKGIFKRGVDFRRLALVTDSVDPEDFLKEGYLDAALKRALKMGVPPELAYQMVTLNPAEHFRLDHLIGSLSPGTMADLLIIPSPNEFSPQLVMCDGKIIFRDGKTLVEPKKSFFPDNLYDTIKVQCDGFPELPKGRVRVIELVTRLVTKEEIIDLKNPEESQDVIMVLASDRLGGGKSFMGFLKGFGLQRGAYGSTMCWDTVDMIVVGCDTKSMKTVIERLKEIRGGGVYGMGDEVIAEFPTPLLGLMSLKPMKTVRDEIKKLEDSLMKNGVKWEKPILTIDTLGTPAIPQLRIFHDGYVRLRDREILSVEV
jgi:adenine deaminase